MIASGSEATTDDRIEEWRRETPGTKGRNHLNNAGSSLPPRPVLDAVLRFLKREGEIGGYEAGDEAAATVRQAYASVGNVLGCAPGNVAMVENATVAVAQALSSFAFKPGDRIVTSRSDYPSQQIMYTSLGRRFGVETVMADDRPEGGIDPESVRRLLRDPRCRLVSLTWVPTNSGLVQPVHAVGEVCAEADVPYLIDACQSVGQMPVDVTALRCDFLAGTARKFLRGPRGIGFLYVADRVLERDAYPLFLDMRGADWTDVGEFRLAPDARRFENWEFNYALILGLGEAARYCLTVGEAGFARARALAATLRALLADLPGIRVLDRGPDLCAIVTVEVVGRDADDVKLALRARGVNTTAMRRTSGVIDMDEKHVTSALRLSPHYFNTDAELTAAVGALAEIAGEGR